MIGFTNATYNSMNVGVVVILRGGGGTITLHARIKVVLNFLPSHALCSCALSLQFLGSLMPSHALCSQVLSCSLVPSCPCALPPPPSPCYLVLSHPVSRLVKPNILKFTIKKSNHDGQKNIFAACKYTHLLHFWM